MSALKGILGSVSILFICILGTTIYHRSEIFSSLELVPGDIGDARFVAFIVDHWGRAFIDDLSLSTPGFFYPTQGTLGFSEALFGYGLFALPLKFFGGFDRFTILQIILILFSFLNFGTMFYFLRSILNLGLLASTGGAFFFAFNSAKLSQSNHLQLHAVWAIPLMTAMLIRFFKNVQSNFARNLSPLLIFGILLNLQLLTSFYYGWFFIFWLGVFSLFALLFPLSRIFLIERIKKASREIIASIAFFILGLLPFLNLYLPALKHKGGREYAEVSLMIPQPLSWFWMTSENYLWGWIPRMKRFSETVPFSHEHAIGFGFGLTFLILFVIFRVIFDITRKTERQIKVPTFSIKDQITTHFFYALVLSLFTIIILMLKVQGDKSLWYFVFNIVPGASSIRAVSRFALVLAFPVAIIFAVFLNHNWSSESSSRLKIMFSRIMIIFFVTFIALEQQHRSIPTFNKKVELQRIQALASTALPQSCKSFYVEPSANMHYPTFALQIDAMYLASEFKIPTINGYSGLSPKEWNLWEIRSPTYKSEIDKWVQLNDIKPAPCRVEIDQ